MKLRGAVPAFSLVELLIVIVTIGLLASIAIPRYSASLVRWRVEAAARRVAADLLRAQRDAKAASAARTVSFDTASHGYTLNGIPDPDRPSQTYHVALSREPYLARLGAVVFGGDASVTFNGFGEPDSGGKVEIRVGDAIRWVVLDAASGEITTSETEPPDNVIEIGI